MGCDVISTRLYATCHITQRQQKIYGIVCLSVCQSTSRRTISFSVRFELFYGLPRQKHRIGGGVGSGCALGHLTSVNQAVRVPPHPPTTFEGEKNSKGPYDTSLGQRKVLFALPDTFLNLARFFGSKLRIEFFRGVSRKNPFFG